MFSYYGSKSKIVEHYPTPKMDKIIEPFCGSARYACEYPEKQVLLIDKYDVVIDIWNYLIKATERDIMNLPLIDKGQDLRNFETLSKTERNFISFCIGRGSAAPRNTPGSFNNWQQDRKRISQMVGRIKHWEARLGEYEELQNEDATWFIDPPYQFGGEHYRHNSKKIDFIKLGEWCKTRDGQVIVCENSKADWMDFKRMIKLNGQMYETTEVIWTNQHSIFDNIQTSLF